MDKFEKLIKEAVEGYEAPFNPQVWDNVSKNLNKPSSAWKWMVGGAAATIAVVGTLVALNSGEEAVEDIAVSNDVIAENVVADNAVENKDNSIDFNNESEIVSNEESNGDNSSISSENEATSENISSVNIESSRIQSSNQNDEGAATSQVENHSENNETDSNEDSGSEGMTQTTVETSHNEMMHYSSTFVLSSHSVCLEEGIACIAQSDYKNVLYVWDMGNGEFLRGKEVEYEYSKPGTYEVKLNIRDAKSNKILASSTDIVEIKALPNIDFTWSEQDGVIPTVKFVNLSNDGVNYTWNIKGLKSSDQNEFEYTFRDKGQYSVSLTAEGANGCSNTIVKTVTVKEDYNLLAPTAFTPNGDFRNDVFIPEALKILDQEFIMTIYDQAGTMVYETRSVSEPWDGNYTKDNSPAPSGGYVWIVKLKNNTGDYDIYDGQVFITR